MEEWLRWSVGGVLGILAVLLGSVLARIFRRQDTLFDSKANKDSTDSRFNETYKRLDKHMDDDREAFSSLGRKIDLTNERLAETNSTLSLLVGRFDGQHDNDRRSRG